MLINPYARTRFVTASGEPVEDLKLNGSRVFDSRRGEEINASSKEDLMRQIGNLLDAYQSGEIRRTHASVEEDREKKEALVTAALNDNEGIAWRALGEVMAEEIQTAMDREGFARKVLITKDLGRGEVGRVPIKKKDVMAWYMTTDANVPASVIRQSYIYPDEFYLNAEILIETRELAQSPVDLLDEKYSDGLEQIMVGEDRVWKILADRAATTVNDVVYYNFFTPAIFATLVSAIRAWNIPCTSAIIAYDLWNDIIGDATFANWFDPVTKREMILNGTLGSILGVELITDAFREPNLHVLNKGEVYFCGAPKTLGAITKRQDVTSDPINNYNNGKPQKGWFISAIEGMTIANSRAIAKGIRI